MNESIYAPLPGEKYYDLNGNPTTREEAKRLIGAMEFSQNVALGYSWTWGGLLKRLYRFLTK